LRAPGIDGLPSIPYHWGTQWLFAQWSSLTGATFWISISSGFPVTMIPFFFGGTLAFAVALRSARGDAEADDDLRDDGRIWFVFLAACIGILPISGLDAMAVWTSNILISESYTGCGSMRADAAGNDNHLARPFHEALRRSGTDQSIALYLLVILPLGIMMLGYLKSSLMMLAFGLALYVFVR
jgi:hypothetical protein